MMMPVAAALAVMGDDPELAAAGDCRALLLHRRVSVHEPGGFAIVAFLRNAHAERRDRRLRRLDPPRPGLVICFSLILVSLIGLAAAGWLRGQVLAFAPLAADPQHIRLL